MTFLIAFTSEKNSQSRRPTLDRPASEPLEQLRRRRGEVPSALRHGNEIRRKKDEGRCIVCFTMERQRDDGAAQTL